MFEQSLECEGCGDFVYFKGKERLRQYLQLVKQNKQPLCARCTNIATTLQLDIEVEDKPNRKGVRNTGAANLKFVFGKGKRKGHHYAPYASGKVKKQ
jgi:hypothetical protein